MTESSAPDNAQPEVENPLHGGAASSPRAWAVLAATTIIGLVSDLWSKHAAFVHVAGVPVRLSREEVLSTPMLGALIPQHDPVRVIPGLLEFTLVLNPGAVFGMGAGKRWFFIAFTLLALGFGLYMFSKWTRPREWTSHVAIGLLLAGGLGNLYDRLVFACVRDFLHPLPGVVLPMGWHWPWGGNEVWPYVSNVADLWLCIGIGILVVRTLRTPVPGAPVKV
jgi:signal peptidase II